MTLFGGCFQGRRVLVTGHTGFKGSWLCLWLQSLGAQVSGIALPPEASPNHWALLGLDMPSHLVDIRDGEALKRVIADERPEIVFHLAAQPLVRRSYADPLKTWSTNVMGTASLLDACRQATDLRAVLVVTTDKCYRNQEWFWGYRETDPLGGHDPYSASKAATELVVASYRDSFFQRPGAPLLATARAGNVIGGGDWSEDRLIPDLVRARMGNAPLEIRSPRATRPWQHVLDSLSGYLLLGQGLMDGTSDFADGWNFGPEPEGNRTVEEVLTRLRAHWPDLVWQPAAEEQPHEATLLYLDSSKARQKLGWQSVWRIEDALAATAGWYRQFHATGQVASRTQLSSYVAAARDAGLSWAVAP
jgi:CDP-glucose 4,6-dehydratase